MKSGCSQEKLSDPLSFVALHSTIVSFSLSVVSLASHNGASVTASKSSSSCCSGISPTRGTDDSDDTSVESVDTSVESVDTSVESVDTSVESVDEATLVEVDDATVDEVEVLVDDVVAG